MRWSPDELLLVLHLYERLPFGQQHSRNPQVASLADRLSRSPGSVAMKLNNFTSLDPEEARRGVRGLRGASAQDREMWDAFQADPTVVERAEALWTDAVPTGPDLLRDPNSWSGPTEDSGPQRRRLAQDYFRRVVLSNYEHRCALTDISAPELLVASHIVAWSEAPERRVDPSNGLCLNRLHDAAFDRHILTFDEDHRVVLSPDLLRGLPDTPLAHALRATEGARLREPIRRALDPVLLDRHRRRSQAAWARA